MELDVARFLALVRRELGARDARIIEHPDPNGDPDDGGALRCPLPDGQVLVVAFESPPEDRDAKQRHLEMLASTFDTVVERGTHERRSHPPAVSSLRDELLALCERASAVNALVIDANSPILWGVARPRGVVSDAFLASKPATPDPESSDDEPIADASRRAILSVRALAESAGLRKGKRVRHVALGEEGPFLTHSFAGIYLLVLVFTAPFDELRAERATLESLARIERLVLALPPFNPPPDTGGGVVAIRRSPRR